MTTLTGILDLSDRTKSIVETHVPIQMRSEPLDAQLTPEADGLVTLWHCTPTCGASQIAREGLRADLSTDATLTLGQPSAVYAWASQRSAAVCATVEALNHPTDIWRLRINPAQLAVDRLLDDAWMYFELVPPSSIALVASVDAASADDFWDTYAETAGGRSIPLPFDQVR